MGSSAGVRSGVPAESHQRWRILECDGDHTQADCFCFVGVVRVEKSEDGPEGFLPGRDRLEVDSDEGAGTHWVSVKLGEGDVRAQSPIAQLFQESGHQ